MKGTLPISEVVQDHKNPMNPNPTAIVIALNGDKLAPIPNTVVEPAIANPVIIAIAVPKTTMPTGENKLMLTPPKVNDKLPSGTASPGTKETRKLRNSRKNKLYANRLTCDAIV
jgi:hypothetical protein